MMNEDSFWALIATHLRPDDDHEFDIGPLQIGLSALSAEQVAAFGKRLDQLHAASYSWQLWGAAYLINGGCSDDSFDYFRAWLIASGRERYERAVADPEILVEIGDRGEPEFEELLYVAGEVYEEITGEDLEQHGEGFPDLGEGWDFDDDEEMSRRYPKLFARFS